MKIRKIISALLIGIFFLGTAQNANGQLLKNLKKKIGGKLEQKADKKTDELLNGTDKKTSEQKKESPQVNSSKNLTQKSQKVNSKEAKNNSTLTADIELITYKPPSENFRDIIIASHKGLPRFGHQYQTRKTTLLAYKAMLELKYLTKMYSDINRNKLTISKQLKFKDVKEKNSFYAQRHLIQTLGFVGTENLVREYSYSSESKNAFKFSENNGAFLSVWGGDSQNDFQQMRSYTNFIKNHFEELKKWSDTFFKEDYKIGYFVNHRVLYQGGYDFKNKGYWIRFSDSGTRSFLLNTSHFSAYTEGAKIVKKSHVSVFLSVEPAKAKILERTGQHIRTIYAVYKVRITPREFLDSSRSNRVIFDYELESNAVTLYQDENLTQKIGDIDTENLIIK